MKKSNEFIYCRNGRSCSPYVVGIFYIIFSGLPYSEVIAWFKDVYPQQRPVTAEQSPVFPNLTKFDAVFQLLCGSQANLTINFSGFNLASKIAF